MVCGEFGLHIESCHCCCVCVFFLCVHLKLDNIAIGSLIISIIFKLVQLLLVAKIDWLSSQIWNIYLISTKEHFNEWMNDVNGNWTTTLHIGQRSVYFLEILRIEYFLDKANGLQEIRIVKMVLHKCISRFICCTEIEKCDMCMLDMALYCHRHRFAARCNWCCFILRTLYVFFITIIRVLVFNLKVVICVYWHQFSPANIFLLWSNKPNNHSTSVI